MQFSPDPGDAKVHENNMADAKYFNQGVRHAQKGQVCRCH